MYRVSAILMVLMASAYECHSINSKAVQPDADTVFYRLRASGIQTMEEHFWRMGLQFLRERKKKLKRLKCCIVVDETHESYTGKLLKKEKKEGATLTETEKKILQYIHRYKPKKGDTGSYKYLVFAMVCGNTRRVLRVKILRRKEEYKRLIITTLQDIKKEINYECALFDRGFYDGFFIEHLKQSKIPFIVRAKISKTMKREYGFFTEWKRYNDFEIGEHKYKGDLVLGKDHSTDKRRKWAFITNIDFQRLADIRNMYRKRWNIENVFKATDGIQLRVQTNNPTTRLFCACFSFVLYNAWQTKRRRKKLPLLDFLLQMTEFMLKFVIRTYKNRWQLFRDKLKINILFWNIIIAYCR